MTAVHLKAEIVPNVLANDVTRSGVSDFKVYGVVTVVVCKSVKASDVFGRLETLSGKADNAMLIMPSCHREVSGTAL